MPVGAIGALCAAFVLGVSGCDNEPETPSARAATVRVDPSAEYVQLASLDEGGWSTAMTGASTAYVVAGKYRENRAYVWSIGPEATVRRLPSVPYVRKLAPNGSGVVWGDKPCLGTSDGTVPQVVCFQDEAWQPQGLPDSLAGWAIQNMEVTDGNLVVLLINPLVPNQSLIAAKQGDKWAEPIPGPPISDGILYLGSDVAGSRVLVGTVSPTRRAVWSLAADGSWRSVAASPWKGLVNQNSGPVATKTNYLFSRTDIKGRTWPFAIDGARIQPSDRLSQTTKSPLSRSKRRAQGRLVLLQGRPWAIWQEGRPLSDRQGESTTVYAAALSARGVPTRRSRVAHFARLTWPCSLDVLRVGNRTFAVVTASVGLSRQRTRVRMYPLPEPK